MNCLFAESINMQAHIRFQAFLLTRLENASESLGNKISQLQSKANVQEDETRSLELGIDFGNLLQVGDKALTFGMPTHQRISSASFGTKF